MTFAPDSIKALAAEWVKLGGINLGIVGDTSHAATGGYHEGRDDLAKAGVLATDYSVQLERDKAGLSNAAAALDFGHDDKAELQRFSRWFVEQCQDQAPGYSQVREFIYSPDGLVVKRWSGVDGFIHDGYPTGTGNGDSSHLWHSHCSFWRDTEFVTKAPLLFGYGPTPPDSSTEESMQGIKLTGPALGTVTLGVGHQLISPVNLGERFGPWPDPLPLTVYAAAQPRTYPERVPQDIDGNVPPQDSRDECWLVDNPGFDDAALALRADCSALVPVAGPATVTLGPGLYEVKGA